MVSKQEQRSEETKRSILQAAGELFASRGYDGVTMREIAKEAKCSHTTIYIYFKDKEALLQQLALPSIELLQIEMSEIKKQIDQPEEQLIRMSMLFIRLCLAQRSMYNLFFNIQSERVDEPNPILAVNEARNGLFVTLKSSMAAFTKLTMEDERCLLFTRIYYFAIHGIVATYQHSHESVEQLMERLTKTFEMTFEVMLEGILSQLSKGANE
ncbi:MAG: TetR/AcrR family transcriptional regulator [Candidatus Cohnella colombiensis]|uniref:TetR/AcrR family transcriptional regulator n=1 Tax=Candidatus Cohnella colombiensis TaxID=3121368 RepID=A0AA95JGN7_9BACL|nr:MAG: TetR/AcrR family transcriptional regulator [Cohnella sp.]